MHLLVRLARSMVALVVIVAVAAAALGGGAARGSIAYLTNTHGPAGGPPTDNALYTLQVGTAAVTRVGELGTGVQVPALAWDAVHGIMYGAVFGTSTSQLCTVDLATGHAAVIGPMSIARAHGLAVDPATGTLYGVSLDGQVFSINTATGAVMPIGAASGLGLSGLTFAPDGRAIACESIGGSGGGGLYQINLQTGAATLLFDGAPLSGLGFDPADGQLYGIDNFMGHAYRIDFATGVYTQVGHFNGVINPKGLAFIPSPGGMLMVVAGSVAVAGVRMRRTSPHRSSGA